MIPVVKIIKIYRRSSPHFIAVCLMSKEGHSILKNSSTAVRLKLFLEAAAKLRTFSGLFRESALRTYLFMGRAIGEGNFRQNARSAKSRLFDFDGIAVDLYDIKFIDSMILES